MTSIGISYATLGIGVFELGIALTAAVAVCVVLLALLIALGISKNFRAVFFRENKSKKRKSSKSSKSRKDDQVAQAELLPTEQLQSEPKKTARSSRRRSSGEPDFLDAVQTVPLNGAPIKPIERTPSTRTARKTSDPQVKTITIPRTPSNSGTAYTTRSITITRARTTSVTDTSGETADNQADTTSAQNRTKTKK